MFYKTAFLETFLEILRIMPPGPRGYNFKSGKNMPILVIKKLKPRLVQFNLTLNG